MPSNNVLLKALSLGVVAESVRSPIESMTIPHESYRTVPVSSSTNNTYTSNGMSRDPIIGNEPDLQLLETHCKLQASGFPVDYSCQSIPDHKRASIQTTSTFSSSDIPPLPKKVCTVPVSSSTNNNYTSNGMSRNPIIENEPDLQLLETHCKLQASGFPVDYSCQSIPDHKNTSIQTTSIFSSGELANTIDVSFPITSLLVLHLYINKCLSTYTTYIF